MSSKELIRVDERFRNFIIEIREERGKRNMKKLSCKKIFLLIIRHNSFNEDLIKKDIVNYEGDYDDQ